MMLQQIGDHPRQGHDAGQDAAEKHQKEGRIGHLPGVLELPAQQQHERLGNTGDGTQQLVVDAADEGDGATGHARHHIGSAHGHTLGIEQEVFLHGSFQK